MIRVIIVFFLFYFWLSALVYADSHQLLPFPCDTGEMGMVMDSLEVNPGCDKQDLPPDLFGEDREIIEA